MATFSIIKLTHLSPIHLGTGREATDSSAQTLHSDTLSAALAAMRAQTRGEKGIREFMESFTISSAFPFWKDHFYLPKPQGRINVTVNGKTESQVRKTLKGIQYIESTLWNQLVSGQTIKIDECQIQKHLLSASTHTGDSPLISSSQVNERVSVPRQEGEDAEPFFFEWNYYHKEAGLYMLTDAKDRQLQELHELFSLLGEQGIGTDRNVGGGKFNVEDAGTIELGVSKEESNAQMLLSLFIPSQESLPSLHLEASTYSILLRGGFMAGSNDETLRHLHKKSIYMFNTGSVFKTTTPLQGKIVDLHPDWNYAEMHPVYRSGLPLSIPINIVDHE